MYGVSALFSGQKGCRETRERKGSSKYLLLLLLIGLGEEKKRHGVFFLEKILAICYKISSYILGDLEGQFKRRKRTNLFSPLFPPFLLFYFSLFFSLSPT